MTQPHKVSQTDVPLFLLGAIMSTANDMARWMTLLLNKGTFNGIINPDVILQTWKQSNTNIDSNAPNDRQKPKYVKSKGSFTVSDCICNCEHRNNLLWRYGAIHIKQQNSQRKKSQTQLLRYDLVLGSIHTASACVIALHLQTKTVFTLSGGKRQSKQQRNRRRLVLMDLNNKVDVSLIV